MKKEFLEKCLAEGLSLEQIGRRVSLGKSTVSYHVKKYGLKPVNRGRAANRGALDPGVLRPMVEEGTSLSEMARRTDRSISTVRYWLKKYGLWPLPAGQRREQARRAREQGLSHVRMECPRHGLTDWILEGSGRYRCLKCRREGVIKWRRNAKLKLVKEAGGCCRLCGYDEFPGALHFHHVDPSAKSFGLGMRGLTRSIEKLRAEAAKCILLCANCHAKVEWGVAALPEDDPEESDDPGGDGKLRAAA